MKRIVSLILVAVMLVCALSSCDKINEILGNMNNNETEDKGPSIRHTITEEEWLALENITNFTAKMVIHDISENGDTTTNHITFRSSETATHEENINVNLKYIDEYYNCIVDGTKYSLSKGEDGKWYAREAEWCEIQPLSDIVTFEFDISFSDLVYNEEEQIYVYSFEEDEFEVVITYWFGNGAVSKIEAKVYNTLKDNMLVELFTIEINGIGLTTVVPPRYTVVEE